MTTAGKEPAALIRGLAADDRPFRNHAEGRASRLLAEAAHPRHAAYPTLRITRKNINNNSRNYEARDIVAALYFTTFLRGVIRGGN